MFAYSSSILVAKTLWAPLDRIRILQQVKGMGNFQANQKYPDTARGLLRKIVKEQGTSALWRGNNANIYRNVLLISMNVSIYDRVKHSYMPLDRSRYSGIDFLWRFISSSFILMGITAAVTYPFDLIHTRLAADMSGKNDRRLFATTFDCFNRTNIDEGFRSGVYKGVEISLVASALRAGLSLPVYNLMNSQTQSSGIFGQNLYSKMMASLFSSLAMSVLLYPFDTVKRCLQLNGACGHK